VKASGIAHLFPEIFTRTKESLREMFRQFRATDQQDRAKIFIFNREVGRSFLIERNGRKTMVRGERNVLHRGSRECDQHPARGSDDIPPDLDPDDNFHRGADDESLPGPAEEEYTWPTFEEEEED
jgi:hypothetical protein